MTFRPKHRLACFMVLGLVLVLSGCGDDDDLTTPAQEDGTIIIDQTPDALSGAGWTLTGPKDQTGSGDVTLTEMPLGAYALTWDAVSGYITPTSAPQTLAADGTITFSGTYLEETAATGTIEIYQTPEALAGAAWALAGPQNETGSGNMTLTEMPLGSYALTWDAVSGYITPTSAPQTLAADGTITFSGTYVEDPGSTEDFVLIPAGTFQMGSPLDELGRQIDETEHQVTLTQGFYCQTTEVTNQQYMEMAQWAYDHGYVTATSASLRDNLDGSTQELLDLDGVCEISFSGGAFTVDAGKEDHPVLEVTWYGSVAYCDWLSLQQGLPRAYSHSTWQCNGGNPYTATGYRLPTEAEWEYACRAGSTTAFANGPITDIACNDPNLDQVGWYCGNAGGWTHPVAQKNPNGWGLYDMHGNLYEWCNDWYALYGGTVTDPTGPGTGSHRVFRGGSWSHSARGCRSADRYSSYPVLSSDYLGFRSVRSSD